MKAVKTVLIASGLFILGFLALGLAAAHAAGTPSIAAVQGFNPSTGAYTTNIAAQGTYLILYGSFSPPGDVIAIDGTSATIEYQSSTQINISLNGIAAGSHSVVVMANGLTGNIFPFTVTAAVPTPASGACGPAGGVSFSSAPTYNFCSVGSASSVSGSGPWTWNCSGVNGGPFVSCEAFFVPASGSSGNPPSKSATLSLAVPASPGGVTNGTFNITSSWQANLSSNEYSQPFTLYVNQNNTGWASAPEATDQNGNWSISSSSWTTAEIGSWQEYAAFPDGTDSNTIGFTLNAPAAALPSCNLSASTFSQSVTLSWSSNGATSCTASGGGSLGWAGQRGTNGTAEFSGLTSVPTSFSLSCSNAAGSSVCAGSPAVESAAGSQYPDLTISDFHLTDAAGNPKSSFNLGDAVYPSVTIQNTGNAPTQGTFYVSLYGNAPATVGNVGSDVGVWVAENNSIAAGASKTYSVNANTSEWNTTHWTASVAGSLVARAFVDSFSQITESNENNNQATFSYAVNGQQASPVNGICGASNGLTLSAAPNTNLCSAGVVTSVSGSGPWTWSCNGTNGGSNASCEAFPVASPQASKSANLVLAVPASPGGVTNGTFNITSSWQANLSSNEYSQPFTLYVNQNNTGWASAPEATDQNGNWSISSSSWTTAEIGSWQEYAKFPDGTTSTIVNFTLTAPAGTPSSAQDGASCVAINAPVSLTPGESFTATVTMKNVGSTTWQSVQATTTPYRLGSESPQDNQRWGLGRVDLPSLQSVAPGSQAIFTISGTAPAASSLSASGADGCTTGDDSSFSCPFNWGMVHDGVANGWFGAQCAANVSVGTNAATTTPACVAPQNIQPSGNGAVTGSSTTLSWQAVPGAISYNVRLSDVSDPNQGTGTDFYDDPRFVACNPQTYWYCENGITATNISNVPVKPGDSYNFWIDPIFSPTRAYCNGTTQFTVAPSATSGQTCAMTASPASVSLGANLNGALPAGQNITVTDAGNQPMTLWHDAAGTFGSGGAAWLGISPSDVTVPNMLQPGGSANFTISATSAATAGDWSGQAWFDAQCGSLNAPHVAVPASYNVISVTNVLTPSFPVTVKVTVPSLYVRSAPDTSAPLAGSEVLSQGDTFTAVDEKVGQDVDGVDLWWVSSLGNFVWSGGTQVVGGQTPQSLGAAPVVKSVADGSGILHAVTYTYLPDGETSASFSYSAGGNVLPAAAQGTQSYIAQGGQTAIILPGGSFQFLNGGNDCNGAGGAAACIEDNATFSSLIANIPTNAPPTQFPPGLTFSTPPGSVAGQYLEEGKFAMSLTTDGSGNVLAAHSVNASGYGSGLAWYNLGDGYYAQNFVITTPNYYYLQGGNIPSGYGVVLENAQIAGGATNPTAMTASVAVGTASQIGSSGFTGLTPTSPITLAVTAANASQSVNASGLQVVTIPNSPTALIAGVVLYNGILQSVVNAGGVAAYQYITKNNLSGASVVSLPSDTYEVIPSSGAAVAFDANGEILSSGAFVPTLSISDFLSQIQTVSSVNQAMSLAQQAGLAVAPWDGAGSQGILVFNAVDHETLASVGEWDDFVFSPSPTSSVSLVRPAPLVLASAVSTPELFITNGDAGGASFIQSALAANTGSVAVGNTTNSIAACAVIGTNGAANALVWPSGQIYGGGAGSYQFNIQCNNAGGCGDSDDSDIIASAQKFINGLGAAQLSNTIQTNNIISLNVHDSISPGTDGVALAVSIPQSNGTILNSCTANIGINNILDDAQTVGIVVGTPTYIQLTTNIIVHEILHCMGLGHTNSPLDIMGTPDTAPLGKQWGSNPPSIDPSEVNLLKQIAFGQTLQVESCDPDCVAWQGYQGSNVLNNTEQVSACVDISTLCPDSSKLWNVQTQSCQTCQQLGYPDGWTADQDKGVCALSVPGGGIEAVEPVPSPNQMCLVGMEWDPTQDQCVGPSVTSDICYVLDDGTCSCPGYVAQNGVCTPGGYACDDNGQCVFNANGGPFDNSTCDDACLGAPGD